MDKFNSELALNVRRIALEQSTALIAKNDNETLKHIMSYLESYFRAKLIKEKVMSDSIVSNSLKKRHTELIKSLQEVTERHVQRLNDCGSSNNLIIFSEIASRKRRRSKETK